MKKAIVEKMKQSYHTDWFKEDAEDYPIRVFLLKDEVTVALDTTGDSLHKRGYRRLESKAPIAENLAAALIMLTPWRGDRILVDPFCGSGTFPIEAAMMAANIAPGMNRHFTAEAWKHLITPQNWTDVRDEARDEIITDIETDIQGYDLDPEMVEIARINAKKAGVDHLIHFQARDIADLSHRKKYGFIITNPPYGERIGDQKELPALYKTIGERYKALDSWSMYLITGFEQAEKYIGKKADKNRKIYNGMIRTYFYQYMGPKPPKRTSN
jgi:putative N6-adenine-specific DNA methylase